MFRFTWVDYKFVENEEKRVVLAHLERKLVAFFPLSRPSLQFFRQFANFRHAFLGVFGFFTFFSLFPHFFTFFWFFPPIFIGFYHFSQLFPQSSINFAPMNRQFTFTRHHSSMTSQGELIVSIWKRYARPNMCIKSTKSWDNILTFIEQNRIPALKYLYTWEKNQFSWPTKKTI